VRSTANVAGSRTLSFRRWLALSIAGFVAFFAIWWLIAASGLVQRQFLPTPLEVFERFVALTHTPFVGYTLQQLGRNDEALKYFAQALKIKPGDEMAARMMASLDAN